MKKILKFSYLIIPIILIGIFYSCDDTTVQPASKTTVSGIIMDAQGNTINEAVVEAQTAANTVIASDTTDEDGNFTLKNMPENTESVKLKVSHSDFLTFEQDLSIVERTKQGDKVPVKLLCDTACCGRVQVNVFGPDSGRILNAEVRLNRDQRVIRKGKTNEDGRVVFENVCDGNYWVRIAREGFRVIEYSFTVESCDSLYLNFVLQSNNQEPDSCCHGIIYFRVNDSTNAYIPFVNVNLWRGGTKISSQQTNDGGQVIFRNICPGTYQISYSKEGYRGAEFNFDMDCDDTLELNRTIYRIPEDTCCHGIVKINVKDQTSNESVTNATIKIRKNGVVLNYFKSEAGYVIFTGLCPGEYSFLILSDNYNSMEYNVVLKCNDSLEVTKFLVRKTTEDSCCKGVIKVISKYGNDVIKNASVRLWKNGTLLTTLKSEQGYVLFTKLCPGQYGLDITADGYNAIEWSQALECNDTVIVEKQLTKKETADSCCKGIYKIYVKDKTTHEPVNGVYVKMFSGGTIIKTAKVENGFVLFTNICKGTFSFSIPTDLYNALEWNKEFACNDSSDVTKFLEKKPSKDTCCNGVITVTVRDSSNGNFLGNVNVRLYKGSTKLKNEYTGGDNGMKILTGICAGEYQITLTKDGYKGMEFNFVMECNDTLEFTKHLIRNSAPDTCCTAILKLLIKDRSNEQVISGARVEIYYNGQMISDGSSNAEGWFARDGLCAPRTYSVRIIKDGYVTGEFSFQYAECNKKQETVTLQPQ